MQAHGFTRRHETHDLLAAKKAETANLGRALGISSDYKEGDAFDRELQAERAAAEKEAREAQKAERQAELEKRRKIQEEVEAIRREGQQRKQQRERDMPRGQSGLFIRKECVDEITDFH